MCTTADVRRFLFDDRVISRDDVQTFVDSSTANFAQHGYGLWLFSEKQSDPFAGMVGLLGAEQGAPSLIFAARPQCWGRGYATEAAVAVLDHAFGALGLNEVLADVDEPNVVSVRVLEKLGMTRTRRAIVNGRPLLYYKIERP